MRRGRLVRVGTSAAAVVVALAVIAVISFRVFAPQETLMRPTVPYPEAAMITDKRPFSELRAAPLVVEGRLRVYAEKRRVWSDAPVGGRYEATPYWAYRRWPAQVVGVVAAETEHGPVVVSQWSDGEIVAIGARTGEVAWRASSPDPGATYSGRRTGATTVYEPDSMVTVRTGVGVVVVVTGVRAVQAFDAATGMLRWNRLLTGGCRPAAWTGAAVLALPDCSGPALTFVDAVSGGDLRRWSAPAGTLPMPALCALGRSECRLMTAGRAAWQLGDDGAPAAVPPLEQGAQLAGDRIVYPTSSGVAARDISGTAPLWSWAGKGRLVAADGSGVYLLTKDLMVLGLSPATGHLTVVGCATSVTNERWRLGHVYPTGGGYLALERLSLDSNPADGDRQYFYGLRPVALVELYPPTKLPVWPGKFAACRSI